MSAMVGIARVEEKKLTDSPVRASITWLDTPRVASRSHSHSMATTTFDTR